ncbi:MAG: hypothetical protein Fur0043_18030 [Anaerolineales bacterium]
MPTDIQEQIERRRERARAEILKIINKGHHPVFSVFEVSSVSKKSYRVEIRSLEELHNSCTCPDYKANLIGTCKHIEGVLLYLEKEYGEKLKELAAERPRGTQIYLHHGMDVTVRVALPFPDNARVKDLLTGYFDASGLLTGDPLQTLPSLLADLEALPARERSLVRVTEAVHEHLALLQDQEEVARQKEWFLEQVQSGRRTFDVLSTKLYPYQEEGAMHLAFGRRAMLADDMGLGKCVGRDTPVFVNGLLRRADTIWDQFAGESVSDGEGEWAQPTRPLWVNALDAQGRITQARIARLYRQRIHESVRRVRLDDGSELTLTRRHKLLLRDGWNEHFQAGDVVCVPSQLNWYGEEADPDLVTLLAWQIAEGYEFEGRATVRITQKDVHRLEQLREIALRVGEKFHLQMNSLAIYQPKNKCAYLTIDSPDYLKFLAGLGYVWGEKSAGKSIPDFIMQAGNKTIRLFLREFFTAEGSAVLSMRSVEISSASSWLIQQISVLLRRFGIWLRCSQKEKCAANGSGIFKTYHFGILGGNSARRFLQEIGFSDEAKQVKLESICSKSANTNVEGLPVSDIVMDMASRTGLPQRHFGVGAVYFTGTQEFSRESVSAVVGALDGIWAGAAEAEYRQLPKSRWTAQTLENYASLDPAYLNNQRMRLSEWIEREVFYARIVSVQDVEYDGWVYDFEVEEHHNFVAAQMLCHNTVQAIAASALLKELRDVQSVLVICPASLKHQWAREIRRFTPLSVLVVEGGALDRRKLYNTPSFFKIINYELVRHDLDELLKLRPDLIILDEAQRIKNWRTKTAMMVKSLPSRYAFVLTGTPLENRIDELYSIFQFLDPRILGPLWYFNDRFYELEKRESGTYKVLGYKNLDQLRALIKPYLLRRTRDEVLKDLPERVDNHFFVEMTDPQWKAYQEFQETVARLLAAARRRPLTPKEHEILLMSLVKMRLICNALALHDKDIPPREAEKTAPKLGEFEEILAEQIASNGHKAVVFSQWANMLALTEPVIQRLGVSYVKLTGDVPSSQRGALIQKFFDDPECRVFLSTDAGGVGLNLQAASLVINLDLPWNPAVLEQRIARAHRHGQSSSVQVINLVAKDTIEERMLDTLAAKKNVFATIFGTDEAPAAIKFADMGQSLLQKLGDLLKPPAEVELVLAPVTSTPEEAAPFAEVPASLPTLRGFADLLLDRIPNRIQLVRKAPYMPGATGEGVIVVVSGAPAELRPAVESVLSEYFTESLPQLYLMDTEGFQSLASFVPALATEPAPEEIAYRAEKLSVPERKTDLPSVRRRRAGEGLAFAEKRLALADLLLKGDFPEEMTRPLRESLAWALTSLLALHTDRDPSSDLPSPRLIQAELVDAGHLPVELAQRLAHVRDLTAPSEAGEDALPLSAKTGAALLEAVGELIALIQEQSAQVEP